MSKNLFIPIMLSSFAAFVATPATAQINIDIGSLRIRIVSEAPPRPRVEPRPVQVHREDVWIAGYWDLRGDRWEWTPGRWDRPVGGGVRWVPAVYIRDADHWRYDPGHWSNQQLADGDDYKQWKEAKKSKGNQGKGKGKGKGKKK